MTEDARIADAIAALRRRQLFLWITLIVAICGSGIAQVVSARRNVMSTYSRRITCGDLSVIDGSPAGPGGQLYVDTARGGAALHLSSQLGPPTIVLETERDGSGRIVLLDRRGRQRVVIGVDANGDGKVVTLDASGEVVNRK